MRSNLSVVGSVDYQSCLCHHAPYKDIQIMVLVKAGVGKSGWSDIRNLVKVESKVKHEVYRFNFLSIDFSIFEQKFVYFLVFFFNFIMF